MENNSFKVSFLGFYGFSFGFVVGRASKVRHINLAHHPNSCFHQAKFWKRPNENRVLEKKNKDKKRNENNKEAAFPP